jgi:glycosyltransferase involved in cell wall biosynthesis
MKLLYFITEDWYFWSHRLPLAQEAKRRGYEVLVVTRVYQHGERMRAQGFRVIELNMQRRTINPWKELSAIVEIINIYRREKPDIVHHVGMKPILYGSIAAYLSGVRRVVNALAGLGYVFTSPYLKAQLLRPFIKHCFRVLLNRRGCRLILQNKDDRALFIQSHIVNENKICLIKGSGVDTAVFHPTPEPSGIPVVVLASRMLWDKGVGEFVAAAKLLKERQVKVRCVLVGDSDQHNPNVVSRTILRDWAESRVVEWWDQRDDIPAVFAQASVVCLPTTYGEGVPKVLLEAVACGLPIVATDAPGCREVVRHGENGFLVPIRNAVDLANAIQQLIADPGLRRRMGARGREIAVSEFAVERVVAETMALYDEMLNP